MVFVPYRLSNIYNNIINSNLITNKATTDENLQEFQTLLNQVIPKYNEFILYRFIKDLSSDLNKFNNFLKLYDCYELILWANLNTLLDYFKLKEIIYIKNNYVYNKGKKTLHSYTINKYISKTIPVESKKMDIKEILKRHDNNINTNLDIVDHNAILDTVCQKDNLSILDMVSNNANNNSTIDLSKFEEEYFKEDESLWDRRNKLREQMR